MVVIALGAVGITAGILTNANQGPHAIAPVRAEGTTNQSFYFVMTDRFNDGDPSNNDGGLGSDPQVSGYDNTNSAFYQGGDLKGIEDKLDYIQGLGVNAIWVAPPFTNKAVQPEDSSAGYHGYWITDFTSIDPHLGGNDAMTDLITAAHDRGLKVYFDIITNHTADVIGYQGGDRLPYVSTDEAPYKDSDGNVFSPSDVAGSDGFPTLSADTSFPYTPVLADGEESAKSPEWLNDVTMYHNRGNSTFTGEDALFGDFVGLDDLFTEDPRVVQGMTDIYTTWIKDFDVDGFRIDTMRHVNDEFWQSFGPDVLQAAKDAGKDDFFMFGEVFDTSRAKTSHFTTTADQQAVLDFPFQDAARNFASRGGSAEDLAAFYADDDWYTDADSSAYELPTFLGNHDMGRFGGFLQADNANASQEELLQQFQLANSLMYLTRGNPITYYGDEQGLTGDGGDRAARQVMFGTTIPEYTDDVLIGSTATLAEPVFDTEQPLYQQISALNALRNDHPTLATGAQITRYSDGNVFAFSRFNRDERREYVVVLNSSAEEHEATIPTWGGTFSLIYGDTATEVTAGDDNSIQITVPSYGAVVFRADAALPGTDAPQVQLTTAAAPADDQGRLEVTADVTAENYAEVSFWRQAVAEDGTAGEWTYIGTDDNAPYRVFDDVSDLAPGTSVTYQAVASDGKGHDSTSETLEAEVPAPSVTLVSPAPGELLGEAPVVAATVLPAREGTEVTIQRRVQGGDWEDVGTDNTAPVYSVTDDLTTAEAGKDVEYRALATQAGVTSESAIFAGKSGAMAQPDEVALPGTVNSVMGCGEDWAPWCDEAQMTFDEESATWSITVDLPAGDYEFKIALNRTWDENYGDGGVKDGPNIPLSLTKDSTVTFTYDNATHLVTVTGAG
ncbi:alpha-amylase family glycosyl hydrolase [Demequina sp.]|uniref:alpha-amylase family glycosyl hydrolase n=1 Tax=Demequina sp. TaxID=2050685 RepID=UPI003D0A1309